MKTATQNLRTSNAYTAGSRPASVLLIVLVVLVLLSLGAYTFSEFMIVESQGTAAYGRDVQARALADSGVELAASLLSKRYESHPQEFYHNPEWFQGVLVVDSQSPRARGRFSIVAPVESDATGTAVRFGLVDESSRLNLNVLNKLGLQDDDIQKILMSLPDMTVDVADSIMDWIDTDQTTRQNGAEDDYYLALSPPYKAKNGPLDSIDELLMVKGVTPQLLFGQDANRSGMTSYRGWAAFLTVNSREVNQRSDGTARINVMSNALGDLYDQIAAEFDEDTAKFVVAYRMNGAQQSSGTGTQAPTSTVVRAGSGGNTVNTGGAGSGGGTTTAQDVGTGGAGTGGITVRAQDVSSGNGGQAITAQQTQAGTGVINSVATGLSQGMFGGGGGQVTRGGIDLTAGGSVQVNSLYELFGVSTRVQVGGVQTTLTSPWTAEPSDMAQYLPKVMDILTTSSDKFIEGRINVSQARREVLIGLPNMTDMLADAIVAAQSGTMGQASNDRLTNGWLVINGLTDLATMRSLDKYLTARGDVFRLQVVGYFDAGGHFSRIEAVIDGTQDPPQPVFVRDLSELGPGFPAQLLSTGTLPTR